MDKETQEKFEQLSRQLIKWLNDNCHPHTKIIIDSTSAELVEGITAHYTEDFLKD